MRNCEQEKRQDDPFFHDGDLLSPKDRERLDDLLRKVGKNKDEIELAIAAGGIGLLSILTGYVLK